VRQSHHFRQLFKVLEMAGYPAETDSALLEFGFMSLPEGAISTRKGNTISLENLLAEAETRAKKIIKEKNPDLGNKEKVAKQVALAAIKYFDLSHNRQTEIIFNWDTALSFEGNTGPYLQYTHARIHGIFRKAGSNSPAAVAQNIKLEESELTVLRKLHQFPEIVELVAEQYFPNALTNYLFELAQHFNTFYQELSVLKEANMDKKNFRLNLIQATAQVLNNGLNLLGIEAPEEM
jgi:arginyl-tRNA synthetase